MSDLRIRIPLRNRAKELEQEMAWSQRQLRWQATLTVLGWLAIVLGSLWLGMSIG